MSEESFIDQIKKDLASMPIRTEPKNAREVVVSLKDNILERLEKKASLEEAFEIVRKGTPENIKMTFSTFKKYWQEERSTTGLTKKRRKENRKNNSSQPLAGRSEEVIARQDEVATDAGKEGLSALEALKRPAFNLNRGDSHMCDFVIHPVWEDGSCQHLCQRRFGRVFSDILRKG